jgi:hypothetical protein
MSEREYDRDAPRIYARVGVCFYGEPFLSRLAAEGAVPVLVVEDESGHAKVRRVSAEFAEAWEKEFGSDGSWP